MPRVQWPNLITHIPSMVLYWIVYIVGLYTIIGFSHGFVVYMFENIPDVEITFTVVAVVAVLMATLVIFSQFVSNKKDEMVKAKKAKLAGETYDEINGEISAKMFWGYPIIAIIAAAIITVIVMLAINELATTQYAEYVSTSFRAAFVGCVAELVAFAIVDRFYLRSAMDGLFFEKVEKPITETFLKGDVAGAIEETVKTVKSAAEQLQKYLDAGFSEEEALERMKK